MDDLANIIFFLVGLGIGLLQLHIGQRQFEAQQKEKMEEIRSSLAEIKTRVSVLTELSTQRSFDLQDKLISLATNQRAVTQVAEETSIKVRDIVVEELTRAGVPDAIERTKAIEARISQTVEKSATNLAGLLAEIGDMGTPHQNKVFYYLGQGLTEKEIAHKLNISEENVIAYLDLFTQKMGLQSAAELKILATGFYLSS